MRNYVKGSKPAQFALITAPFLVLWRALDSDIHAAGSKEISFQTFKAKLLPSDDLERVVVVNGNTARVFLKNSGNR